MVSGVACLAREVPSDGGSGGVVFARCKTGAFVIKGCSTVAQEVVAGCIGQVLGVPLPRFRVVSWPGAAWSSLQDVIKRLLAAMPPERCAALQKVKKGMDRPHLLIFEMASGHALGDLEGDPASSISQRSLRLLHLSSIWFL